MGISRSTYYDAPVSALDDTAMVEAIAVICDDFEHYGWRRVQAGLRQQGQFVNHKKIKRLMREHDLQPRTRRRYVATTDSDHDHPIFPNLSKDMTVDGPNQLWVSDITYGAPRPGWSGVHMTGMLKGKEEDGDSLALCCEGGMSPSGGDLPSIGRVT
jgi:putative transposase